ncbi:MAG: hypothetical protein R3228_01185 [Halioglobus sp.]|nr:hypothetical protein [Halioglobus sp.]
MNGLEERKLVYTALLIACGAIALGAGPVAGLWSFFQVAVMIELACWLGAHRGAHSRRHWL